MNNVIVIQKAYVDTKRATNIKHNGCGLMYGKSGVWNLYNVKSPKIFFGDENLSKFKNNSLITGSYVVYFRKTYKVFICYNITYSKNIETTLDCPYNNI